MVNSTCNLRRPWLLPSWIALLLVVLIGSSAPAGPAVVSASAGTQGKIALTVRETAGVPRRSEVIRSGVPLPRSLGLKSTDRLAVVDAGGARVPAEFRVLARWNAGRGDASAPIQWLLVAFPATVGAQQATAYTLVTDGSAGPNPAPARPVSLARSGDTVTVDTGAAVFRLGGDPGALFDEVVLDNGSRLVTGGSLTGRVQRTDVEHPRTRRIVVEHAGPLSAVVVVEGEYDLPAIGGGGIGSRRRYEFTAGSPTAVVRHSVAWEGNLACNGCVKTTSGQINGVLVERMRDRLELRLGGGATVTAIGRFGAPAVARSVPAGKSAAVRQLLRPNRHVPPAYEVEVAGTAERGAKADGALLAASGPAGTVGIALARMHRYEPQALRLLSDGSLAVDVVDDKAWLAHHQGLFATLAVTALPGGAERGELERLLWAPLNRPLHAWPQAGWFAGSDAVDEFPAGPLPAQLAGYDTLVRSVLDRTVEEVDRLGTAGLMTFGVYPRYWAKPSSPGEIDCQGSADPTPGEKWDDLFWCGAWTDYHNTVATAPIWAMRTGEVEWLDEIAFPGALRTLHTQIMQCGPGENWFYCGQAPAGYGAYRKDFNSSHAYFDNLFLYYWLTGDSTVIDVLRRGGENMRRWMCDTRGPGGVIVPTGPGGPACAPSRPLVKATFVGRVAAQWLAVFRFLGLASPDGSFLEDYRGGVARGVTQQYAELTRDGVSYGLFADGQLDGLGRTLTEQTWMTSHYDANILHRLMRDTGDAPIGEPALAPSRVLAAWARTMRDLTAGVQGDGTLYGKWPNRLAFTGSGARIGGKLAAIEAEDRPLYSPEKGCSTALFAQAARLTGDKALLATAWNNALFTIAHAQGEQTALGKLHGQHLSRLHAAVAALAGTQPPPGVTQPPVNPNQPNNPNNPKPPSPKPPKPTPPAPINATTPPAAPDGLTATQAPRNKIELRWKDNSDNEHSFHIEKIVRGVWQEVRVVGPGATGYTMNGFAAGVKHTFRVRASNNKGPSGYSNAASTL